jgi:glutaredoxin 3
MPKSITIYTSNTCTYCVMVKKYLDMKGASYSEINIETEPARQKELLDLSGQQRVPVTVIEQENGQRDISVGYNLASLSSALA